MKINGFPFSKDSRKDLSSTCRMQTWRNNGICPSRGQERYKIPSRAAIGHFYKNTG